MTENTNKFIELDLNEENSTKNTSPTNARREYEEVQNS